MARPTSEFREQLAACGLYRRCKHAGNNHHKRPGTKHRENQGNPLHGSTSYETTVLVSPSCQRDPVQTSGPTRIGCRRS